MGLEERNLAAPLAWFGLKRKIDSRLHGSEKELLVVWEFSLAREGRRLNLGGRRGINRAETHGGCWKDAALVFLEQEFGLDTFADSFLRRPKKL